MLLQPWNLLFAILFVFFMLIFQILPWLCVCVCDEEGGEGGMHVWVYPVYVNVSLQFNIKSRSLDDINFYCAEQPLLVCATTEMEIQNCDYSSHGFFTAAAFSLPDVRLFYFFHLRRVFITLTFTLHPVDSMQMDDRTKSRRDKVPPHPPPHSAVASQASGHVC